MKNKKILVITRSAWRDDNSTGNTLSNFFDSYPSENIANLYVREENPDNKICNKYFKISEKDLINKKGGSYFTEIKENTFIKKDITKNKTLRFFRSIFLLWVREIIWKIFNWKTLDLDKFIKDFKPDIIFMPVYDAVYMHNICRYVSTEYNIKIVSFHADDYLSYRCFSLSPLFWINRYYLKKSVEDIIKKSKINFCISQAQVDVYTKILDNKVQFDLLYKAIDVNSINKPDFVNLSDKKNIKIIYAGNLEIGRDKTIQNIAKVIEKNNKILNNHQIILEVYSATTNKFPKYNIENVFYYPSVPFEEIQVKLKEADFLLHVESFQLKEKLTTSLSFSTKIVDYLAAGKCILAIGWEEAASILYIKDNKCGLVYNSIEELEEKLRNDLFDENLYNLNLYKAFEITKSNHNKDVVLKDLINKIDSV